jgi:hypothetical protein
MRTRRSWRWILTPRFHSLYRRGIDGVMAKVIRQTPALVRVKVALPPRGRFPGCVVFAGAAHS